MSQETLSNLLHEERRFEPPAELAANANVKADAYAEAEQDLGGHPGEGAFVEDDRAPGRGRVGEHGAEVEPVREVLLDVGGDPAEDFEGVLPRFCELLDRAELTQALEEAWKLVRRLNRYVEEMRSWELAKDEADPERLDEVLYNLAEGIRVTTLLLVPYLPQSADRLLSALAEDSRALAELGSRPGGQRVERVPPLFPKIESEG